MLAFPPHLSLSTMHQPKLTDLPFELLRRIMLFTMDAQEPRTNRNQETFLNASDSSLLRNGIYLAFTCRKMFHVFHDSLTGVKLVSSWQTEQRTLIAACKIASSNLRAIHVECSAPVTAALREVVRMRPPIRHFVLIGVNISKFLMADIICFVGHSLQKLVISAAPSLDDCIVDLISAKCQRLRYLELGGSRRVTNESLISLFENLGHSLRGVEFNALQHDSLDGHVLFTAALCCTSLSYIRLLKLRWVTDACLGYFFKLRAHQLTEVRLEACPRISFHTLCVLGRYGIALEKLALVRTEWSSSHLPGPNCSLSVECHDECELRDSVDSSLNVAEKAFVQVSRRCSNLRNLTISDVGIRDEAIDQLSNSCTSMERLTLRHCTSLGDPSLRAIGESLKCLSFLDISYLPLITDQGMEHLLSSLQPSLKEVQVIGCKALTDRTALVILPRYGRHLRVVRLSYCNFSRQAIATLRAALPRVTLCGTSSCAIQ